MIGSLLLGLAYFALASVSVLLTRFDGGVGLIWGATALLSARLIVLPTARWAGPILSCTIANVIVVAAFGLGQKLALPMALVSISEAIIGVLLLRRWHGTADPFGDLRSLARFTLAIGIAAPFCRSVLGVLVTVAMVGVGDRTLSSGYSIFAGHALGALVLTPILLLVSRANIKQWLADTSWPERAHAALLLALVALVSTAVFSQTHYPLLFLPLLPMQLATFRLGRFGATASLAILALVGGGLTILGHGPVHLIDTGLAYRAWFLQFYLVTATMIALPSATELTRRKQLSAALAKTEQRYRLLAENSNDMIVRIELSGVRSYVSPACHTLLGYEPHELIGASPAGAIHPEDRAGVIAICRSLLDGAREPIATYRQMHRDGHYVWLEASYRLIRDPASGRPLEFVASVRDIGRRKDAELRSTEAAAKLTESHRMLTMAEKVGQIGHWYLDITSRRVIWSDVVCRIHGVPSGFSPSFAAAVEFYHPDFRKSVAAQVRAAVDEGKDFDFTAPIRRADGAERYVTVRGCSEMSPDGQVIGVFGVLQDVTRAHESARSLRESEARHRAASQQLTAGNRLLTMAEAVARLGHWRIDSASGTHFWSDEAYRILGVPIGGRPTVKSALDLYHPDDAALARKMVREALATGSNFNYRARITRPNGETAHIFIRGEVERDADGASTGLFGIIQDVSEQVATEQQLLEREARYRIIADRSGDIVLSIDVDGTIRYASPSIALISGYAPEAVIGRTAQDFVWHEDAPAVVAAHFRAVKHPDKTEIFDYRVPLADGSLRWFETHTRAIVDADGRTTGVVSAMRDVTQRKRAEAELTAAANSDPLTGLANRRAFDGVLERRLAQVGAGAGKGCLAMIDIDHFKQVNDTHGHEAGDLVIKSVAATLARETRDGDLVARFGGEEFAVLLWGVEPERAQAICDRIRANIESDSVTSAKGAAIGVTVSLGVAAIAADVPADALLRRADAALYSAKTAGRNCLKLAA